MNIVRRAFTKYYIRQGFSEVYAQVREGRMVLALEKLDILHNEFPSHGSVLNEKGNIYAKYLGCGKHAHELYCEAVRIDPDCMNALLNATDYSLTEDEFRERCRDALKRITNNIPFSTRIQQVLAHLDSGVPYGVFLLASVNKHRELKRFGLSAAFAELIIEGDGISEMANHEQLLIRRNRAQCLRSLDSAAASSYSHRRETYPATERLALLEAARELDRAIALDEYDHELWNLKAAWYVLLGRFDEVLDYSEKSLSNAPADYIKPFVNRMAALQGLGRRNEMRQCLENALGRVDGDTANPDIEQMRDMILRSEGGFIMSGNNDRLAQFLLTMGHLFGLLAFGLLVSAGLAWFGLIPGIALFYGLSGVALLVLHFILVSLGGQILGGLR